jgi:hypothetical protein
MSLVRRPVAAVLSLASTVLVGGVAWGLVSAHADDATTPAAPVGASAPAPTTTDAPAPAASDAPVPAAATSTTSTKPAPKPPAPRPAPPKPAPAKTTVPTTVTLQAVSTNVGESQMYRAIFRGSLVATPTKKGVPAQRVVLMRRPAGATGWTRVLTAVSSAPDGKLLIALEQTEAKASYRFVFDGQAPYKASASAIVTVTRN